MTDPTRDPQALQQRPIPTVEADLLRFVAMGTVILCLGALVLSFRIGWAQSGGCIVGAIAGLASFRVLAFAVRMATDNAAAAWVRIVMALLGNFKLLALGVFVYLCYRYLGLPIEGMAAGLALMQLVVLIASLMLASSGSTRTPRTEEA